MGTQTYRSQCCGDTQNPALTICELLAAGKLGPDQFGGNLGLLALAKMFCEGITVNSNPAAPENPCVPNYQRVEGAAWSASIVIPADNLISISAYCESGTVTVDTGFGAYLMPVSTSVEFAAEPGNVLTKTITIDATAGVVFVAYVTRA